VGLLQIDADTLARSRFVVSALSETIASLIVLQRATPSHFGERDWLAAHLPAYRDRLGGDPVTALLVRSAFRRGWYADFLTPTPPGEGHPSFADELARIRQTSPEAARTDLTVSLEGPLPPELHRSDLPDRAADLVEWVWTEAVRPYWPRRRRLLEADLVARTRQLSLGGWAAALNDLNPNMRWLGDGRLQIHLHDYPPRSLSGARLLFVPTTPALGWASWEADRYALVYPCSGVLTEPDGASAAEALGRLLGPARASILLLLAAPKSTTQLVALTGQRLGSVGRHLRILLEAGLVSRRRAGHSVLYYRTDVGDALAASRPHEGPAPR
jgi:DNA-binding transcriptional ArsR family regulator